MQQGPAWEVLLPLAFSALTLWIVVRRSPTPDVRWGDAKTGPRVTRRVYVVLSLFFPAIAFVDRDTTAFEVVFWVGILAFFACMIADIREAKR